MRYTNDTRSLWVTTKDTAPGGRRTEKVGLLIPSDRIPIIKTYLLLLSTTCKQHYTELQNLQWLCQVVHLHTSSECA